MTGLGTDIVSLKDFDKILNASPAFLKDHFTKEEMTYAGRGHGGASTHLAVRYAAKEAAIKALESLHLFRSKLIPMVNYLEIEIARDPQGRPYLIFHGEIKKIVQDLKIASVVSLSHDGDYAIAQVILEKIR